MTCGAVTLRYVYSTRVTITGCRKRQNTELGPLWDILGSPPSTLAPQLPHHGTATQGLPSGVLGTLNKSAHQSQHDSDTAL